MLVLPLVLAGEAPAESVGLGDIGGALFLAVLAAIPLGITLWAFLDAARRPRWAWALSKHRQIVWMSVTLLGAVTVIGGLVISGVYLLRIRPRIAAIEAGDLAG